MRFTPNLVVDAGAAHVAVASFSRGTNGTLRLEEFALETRTSDPAQDDAWLERTAEAMISIAAARQWGGPAAMVVPGHLTLTKFVTAPAVPPAQREPVIRFEAAQAIPHPLEAVTWDHLVVPGDELEMEVMLTAVKRDVMENFCGAAERAGFPVNFAASSCLALYRAFQFNYPGVSGPALIVDIGARSTNLLLVGPRGRFFARTIPLAGNAITVAVAEELRLDFEEAEALKLQVLSDLPKALRESPMATAVRRAEENFYGRLQMEIARTIGNFSWRTGAPPPVAIYLTGGGSSLAGLAPVLTEKFKVPVRRYDPFQKLELSEHARASGVESAPHLLVNLIGLAGPETGATAEAGLLPSSVRVARAFRKRQPVLLGAATLLVLALLPPVWYYHRSAKMAERCAAEVAGQLKPLSAMAQSDAAGLQKIATVRREIAEWDRVAAAKASWAELFGDLQMRLGNVEDVWLDQLAIERPAFVVPGVVNAAITSPASDLKLRLSGRLLDVSHPVAKVSDDSYARVKELLAGFGQSPFIAAIEAERFDNSRPGMLRFDFTLRVNPQHPL